MREIGAVEAKSNFDQLLDWVEAGEEVVITRRGKAVARLVRPAIVIDVEANLATIERIRERRKGVTLGGLSIRDMINEGRR